MSRHSSQHLEQAFQVLQGKINILIEQALDEDIGTGDVTSLALISPTTELHAALIARQGGILAGLDISLTVFKQLDSRVLIKKHLVDGDEFSAGMALATIKGQALALLAGERLALNLLQRLCGIATLTHRYVEAVQGTEAKILDTRKTTPGLRAIEKYAVLCGGGENHRFGLFDMALVKDNHLALLPADQISAPPAQAVQMIRQKYGHDLPLEVEVDNFDQLTALLPAAPDLILLDNFTPEQLHQAVNYVRSYCCEHKLPTPLLEASGGVNLASVRAIAETGVERISVGALTYSAAALDIGLDYINSNA